MFFETFLILLIVSAVLLFWGWKSTNAGIFMTGGLIIVTIGVLLYVSGLTTTSATNITTVKTIVDGNSTYSTTLAFQNISVDNDKALWAISFVMMIVGIIGTLVGFTFIRRKG